MAPQDGDDEGIMIVRNHFARKGYRVHSGLQFGCELILYADDPSRVHSDFCVHIVPPNGHLDWRNIQTLVRLMTNIHKTLVVVNVRRDDSGCHLVEELQISTEHSPFRRTNKREFGLGDQVKQSPSA